MTHSNSLGDIAVQPTAYLLHFEATYNPAKSGPPRFSRLVVTDDGLERNFVRVSEVATGPFLVRVQGMYAARDGEIFECVDRMHAEVFVV
jgi:hypothetical protein